MAPSRSLLPASSRSPNASLVVQNKSVPSRRRLSSYSLLAILAIFLLVSIGIEWRILHETATTNRIDDKTKIGATSSRKTHQESFFLHGPAQSEAVKTQKKAPNKLPPTKTTATGFSGKEKDDKKKQEDVSSNIKATALADSDASFQTDPLCGGCRSLKMEHLERGIHKERCGALIYRMAKEEAMSILQAAQKVIQMNHTDCIPCLECDPSAKQYWRYDRVAPTILNAKTHYFRSIPQDEHRIPTAVLTKQRDLTDYFASLNQQGDEPKQYFFEYNPSIIPLPDHVTFPHLGDDTSNDNNNDKPLYYLASFRIATQQACFPINTTLQMIGGEWESNRRPKKKDYVGLALMRSDDLSVVEEAVIDLPRRFRKREDFRLFVLHNQIYIASYCKITPLWIYHESEDEQYIDTTTFNGIPSPNWKATSVFPSPLRVRIGSDVTQCAKERNDNQHSKNLNFFVNTKGETMTELFPLAPHVVRPLPHVLDAKAPTPGREDDISDNTMPPPSFYTVEEPILANEFKFFGQVFTDDRGGACCISIRNPQRHSGNEMLWLGISHVKTPHARRKLEGKLKSNQYLSRWYAFEQEEYKVVAVSGFFCLPSLPIGQADKYNHDNPLVPHATKQWKLGSLTLDCPKIHFVTGMTEKIGDPDKLIVAYGVGDCTSWFIEINKSDVIQLLFEGPHPSNR